MKITLKKVVREFRIPQVNSKEHSHTLFDAVAEESGGTKTWFSRRIVDHTKPWKDSVIVMNDAEVIGTGEDPRAFTWKGSACAYAQTYCKQHGFASKVFIKDTGHWLTCYVESHLKVGKNWVPFVWNDDLYFVHEFSPFRLLKARRLHERDDFLLLETCVEYDIQLPLSHDRYPWLRGGSNGLTFGNNIIGVGHTNEGDRKNREDIVHRPFIFIYRPDVGVDYYRFPFDFMDTFRIVDPTSLYVVGQHLYLVTCETERIWSVPDQAGRICLYSLDISDVQEDHDFGLANERLYSWPEDTPSLGRRILRSWRRR